MISSEICSSDRQLQHHLQQRQLYLPPDLELREVLGGDRVRGEADHSGAIHDPVALVSDLQVLSSPVQRIDYKVATSYLSILAFLSFVVLKPVQAGLVIILSNFKGYFERVIALHYIFIHIEDCNSLDYKRQYSSFRC
jgi:hypothetical protein